MSIIKVLLHLLNSLNSLQEWKFCFWADGYLGNLNIKFYLKICTWPAGYNRYFDNLGTITCNTCVYLDIREYLKHMWFFVNTLNTYVSLCLPFFLTKNICVYLHSVYTWNTQNICVSLLVPGINSLSVQPCVFSVPQCNTGIPAIPGYASA